MAKEITLAKLLKEDNFANAGTVRTLPAEVVKDLQLKGSDFIEDGMLKQVQMPNGRLAPGITHVVGDIPKRITLAPQLQAFFDEKKELPAKIGVQVVRATTEWAAPDGKVYPKDRLVGLTAVMQ